MAKKSPPWCLAGTIEAALEVADTLALLNASDTEANAIATMRHIGAIVELAMLATRQLADDLCDEAHKLGPDEEGPQQ